MTRASAIALILVAACSSTTPPTTSNRTATPTSPTGPTEPPGITSPPIEVTGVVASADTSAPLGGTVVYLNGRYQATTDGSGKYDLTGLLDQGPLGTGSNVLWAAIDGYDSDTRYVRSSRQDFHLHAVRRFMVGTPVSIAVSPDDSLCDNTVQDPSFGDHDYVCRILHTTVPADGILTVDAVSSRGERFPLVVQGAGHGCCDVANPMSFYATKGAEVVIFVELPSSATASDTFVVTTAMSSGPPS